MISAPSGMSVGMPTTPGSCASAPPPLVGGGVSSPIQSPIQAGPALVAGNGALGAPAPLAATLGAASLSPMPLTTTAGVGAPAGGLFAAPMVGGAAAAPAAAPAPAGMLGAPAAAATPATPGALVAAATPQRLTTVAPGGNAGDANLVEQTLGVLRRSPAGAQLVDRMLAVGAKVNVISDAEFAALGHGDAHAFFDPKVDTIFLRRSDLADASKVGFAAVALAHEGTHLLDDVGQVSDPFIGQVSQRIAASGGPNSAAGRALQEQAMFELTMIKEARAFTFAGQVAKQLGVTTPATDPTSVAAAGSNDQATYERVWAKLLETSYNPQRRSAAVRNF